ncbi:4-hydroxythreonine-4-phosphate dehydrogenase [Dysgonomonadaceae bacterium PH5-43]|nr:4-hydroxythreonine-4-phosphate dehydrogenase [Dysgonomonadaceae bacterium PH5-43]
MNNNLLRIGISQGDINGVSYELILKTFEDARLYESCIPVLYGSSKVLAYHRKVLNLPTYSSNNITKADEAMPEKFNIINVIDDEVIVELGKQTQEGVAASLKSLEKALADLKAGNIDILLTTPTASEQIIEDDSENDNSKINMLISDTFRIGLVTDKVPFSEVPSLITKETLVNKIKALHNALVRDFQNTSPRIAVLALNPQAGLNEQPGKEETEVIIPAIQTATENKVFCFGPYSADTFFSSGEYMKFDATLAMYYDQGMIAFQTLGQGVKYMANTSKVAVSTNLSASFDKAGKNLLEPDALREALYLGIDLFNNRAVDFEINKNPLRKQYFERGSDNEKLDLTKDDSDKI